MIGDRKTENIMTGIKDTSVTLENIKSTQFIGGQSFVTYITNSDNQYDFALTLPSSWKTARISFTYTAEAATKHHIVKPNIFYRVDNPNVMESPVVGTNGAVSDLDFFQDGGGQGFSSWIMQIANFDTSSHTFYFKYYFYGTVSGTFSTVAL